MKKVSAADIPFVPAQHEDSDKAGVWKKVLFRKEDFSHELEVQMVNWARLPAGGDFAEHYHEDMEEVFIVLSGVAEMRVEKETETLEKGDAVIVPIGKRHTMRNTGRTDVEFIVFGASTGKGGKTVLL
jgi:mannose-6-phosphate isomerase-like protein (cupin superfamily)